MLWRIYEFVIGGGANSERVMCLEVVGILVHASLGNFENKDAVSTNSLEFSGVLLGPKCAISGGGKCPKHGHF